MLVDALKYFFMKKRDRTTESRMIHDFEEGVVTFYDNFDNKHVDTGKIILYFFKTSKSDKKKVEQRKLCWTDKINAMSVSAMLVDGRRHLTVKSVDNGCLIVLKSPSQAFDSKGKSQKKLMQKHLCVLKNCEVIDSCFNQRCDNIDVCHYLGNQSSSNLLQMMISGFESSELKEKRRVFEEKLLDALPCMHLRFLSRMSCGSKLLGCEFFKNLVSKKDDEKKLDGIDYSVVNSELEKVLCDCYDEKTDPLVSVDKKIFYNEMFKLISVHEDHVKEKGLKNPTLKMMPNQKLKHVHKLCMSLSSDKIMQIETEKNKFNLKPAAKNKTNSSIERKGTSAKFARRKNEVPAKSPSTTTTTTTAVTNASIDSKSKDDDGKQLVDTDDEECNKNLAAIEKSSMKRKSPRLNTADPVQLPSATTTTTTTATSASINAKSKVDNEKELIDQDEEERDEKWKEHEIKRMVIMKDTLTEGCVRLHYEDGEVETYEMHDRVRIIGQQWEYFIVDMDLSEGVNSTVELQNKDGAKSSANVTIKLASIEQFVINRKRRRNKDVTYEDSSSEEDAKLKNDDSKDCKSKKKPSESKKPKIGKKKQTEKALKKKPASASDLSSHEKITKKSKIAMKDKHRDKRKSWLEKVDSAIFEGMKKVNIDDKEIEDWDDSPAENDRMAKISKSNKVSYKKKVGDKKLSAWVDYMHKLKGNKCVVKSKCSKECFVVNVAQLFGDEIKIKTSKKIKGCKKTSAEKKKYDHMEKCIKAMMEKMGCEIPKSVEEDEDSLSNNEVEGIHNEKETVNEEEEKEVDSNSMETGKAKGKGEDEGDASRKDNEIDK